MTWLEDRHTTERVRLLDTWQASQNRTDEAPRDWLLPGCAFLVVLFLVLAAVARYGRAL